MNSLLQKMRSGIPVAWNASRTAILTSVIVTASLVGLRSLGALQPLELSVYDQFIRLQSDQDPDPRLLIVGITEEDIRNQKGFPLSDRTVKQLLQKLETYEPRAIGLDIIRDVPIKDGQAELLQHFKQSDRVIAVCQVRDDTGPGFPPPPEMPEDLIGFANLAIDPGGIARRALLTATPPAPKAAEGVTPQPTNICEDETASLPALSMLVALRYLDAQGIQPETSSNLLKLGSTVFTPLEANTGPYSYADVGGYQILLNYRSARQVARQVSLTDVLNGKLDPDWVKDRAVLVGYIARSVKDELFTPYSTGQGQNEPMPGVVIHAQIVSQILSTVLDQRPLFWFWSKGIESLWILLWSILGGILAWQIRRPTFLALAIAGSLGSLVGICFGLFTQAGWVPLVPPALALLLTIGGVVLFSRGYAQAIYQGVKGLLKLDIEIDHAKKEQEVAEITESALFQELQTKSEQLRQQRKQATQPDPAQPALASAEVLVNPPKLDSQTDVSDSELDYLQALQSRGQKLRQAKKPTTVADQPSPAKPGSTETTQQPLAITPIATNPDAEELSMLLDNTQPTAETGMILPTPMPAPMPTATNPAIADTEFDFLPPLPLANPAQNPPRLPASQVALSQLHQEIDAYYQQLKQAREHKPGIKPANE